MVQSLDTSDRATADDAGTGRADDLRGALASLSRIALSDLPFRHFTAASLLDQDWIGELRGLDLAPHVVRLRDQRGTDIDSNRYSLALLPPEAGLGLPPAVRRLGALFACGALQQALIAPFEDLLERRLRKVGGSFRTRRSLDLIVDRTGYRLLPHTDNRMKLVTLLLYLDDEPEGVSLGTSLYRPTAAVARTALSPAAALRRFETGSFHYKRELFELVATVPHRANTALAFAPGPDSFHGVEPVAAAGARRFLVQFHILAADADDLIE